jgi:hypothetical protein
MGPLKGVAGVVACRNCFISQCSNPSITASYSYPQIMGVFESGHQRNTSTTQWFIGMVVPRLGVANLHLPEPFLFGLTNGSTYFATYCRPPTRNVMRRPDRPAKKPGALSQQPDLRRFKGFEFRASDYLVAAPCQSACASTSMSKAAMRCQRCSAVRTRLSSCSSMSWSQSASSGGRCSGGILPGIILLFYLTTNALMS